MTRNLLILAILATGGHQAQAQDRAQTVINGKALTAAQRAEFTRIQGMPPLGGNFWYDPASGLWGVVGREAFGVLRPGLSYGPVSPTASSGTTGVFINGRQINMAEALYIKSLLGSVVPGRWWLDGRTGNFGLEGNQLPVGNSSPSRRQPSPAAAGPTTTTTAWDRPRPSARAAPPVRPETGITKWITSSVVSKLRLPQAVW